MGARLVEGKCFVSDCASIFGWLQKQIYAACFAWLDKDKAGRLPPSNNRPWQAGAYRNHKLVLSRYGALRKG